MIVKVQNNFKDFCKFYYIIIYNLKIVMNETDNYIPDLEIEYTYK